MSSYSIHVQTKSIKLHRSLARLLSIMFACLAKFLLVLLPLSQIPIASSLVINQVRERDSDLSNSTIAAACSAPQPTATPSAPAGDTCGDWYKFFFDHFEIHGKNFDPNKFGTDGSGLHDNIKGMLSTIQTLFLHSSGRMRQKANF